MMSAPIFECALPQPPSVNHYAKKGNGRVFLSAKTRAFKAVAAASVGKHPAPSPARLAGEFVFCFGDKRRRDLDNYLKVLLDVLQACGVFLDDSQFDAITLLRGDIAPKNGHVIIKIWELENEH